MRPGFFHSLLLFISSAVVAGAFSPARATIVEPMSLETLADHAVAVMEGVVAEVRSVRESSPSRIVSEVTWTSVTFLKGGPSTATASFVLTVPGGEVDGWQMRVAGAPEFRPGQRWLLFLHSEYRTFPTVGIWEGAFRIIEDSGGVRRVYSAEGGAVVGLENEKGTMVRVSAEETAVAKSSCVGFDRVRPGPIVVTADADASRQETEQPRAMSYAEFQEKLSPIVARSRVHAASAPVGKAVVQEFTPTRLKSTGELNGGIESPLHHRPIDTDRADPKEAPETP